MEFLWSLELGAWCFRRGANSARSFHRVGRPTASQNASTFVIVLWVAFGLVSLTLYFASTMSFELHASDNRACGLIAEQTIDGAACYINSVLGSQLTNGTLPDASTYLCQGVPVGDAHFWLIGRGNSQNTASDLTFALVDEASKLNLNFASSNMFANLISSQQSGAPSQVTQDLVSGIVDWRSTNSGAFQTYYSSQHPPYQSKGGPFESVDELRLVYGANMQALAGEDANRNGALDPDENDENRDGALNPGLLEYVTVYSREPMTNSAGVARANVRVLTTATSEPLHSLLQTNLSKQRADTILSILNPTTGPTSRGGTSGRGAPTPPGRQTAQPVTIVSPSPLAFYRRFRAPPASLSQDEFDIIAMQITVTNGAYILGRINVNTASAAVLGCLPGLSDNPDVVQTLISYRESNPDKLRSIAWIVEALGQNNSATLDALQAADCITTETYQFSADIAAIGPRGKGYRRARFIFDTADGPPKIIYRQDLTHLGWALGKQVRDTWVEGSQVAAK